MVARQGQTVNAVQSAPTIVMLGNQDVMTVYAEISELCTRPLVRKRTSPFLATRDVARSTARHRPGSGIDHQEDASALASPRPAVAATAMYYNGQFDVANADGRLRAT